MRNLKRVLSLTLASVMLLGMMVVGSSAADYADVTSEHNTEAIEVLQAAGIMVGDNGNFNPDKNVTRNEMAVVMSNLMNYRVSSYSGTSPFTDVPAWAEPYVAACYTNGITSGMNATTYGGDKTVTAGQAALMLMKALGYFQYQSDFGTDWLLETTRQGTLIHLFDDVEAGVREAMTRNDVAQLVLNTLESAMVVPDDNVINVNTEGVQVSAGKITYFYRVDDTVRNRAKYSAINADRTATSINGTSGQTIELGEELYGGDLKKGSIRDDYGRPGVRWTYKLNEVGHYADKPLATYNAKVSMGELYTLIGKEVLDDLSRADHRGGLAGDSYVFTVWADGDNYEDTYGSRLDTVTRDLYFVSNSSGAAGESNQANQSGAGVQTEVYLDGDGNLDIVYINTYVMQATSDYNASKGTLNVDIITEPKDVVAGSKSGSISTTQLHSDDFDLENYKEDDYILYTVAKGAVKEIFPAKVVKGEVNAYSKANSVTIDGTKYAYGKRIEGVKNTGLDRNDADKSAATEYRVGDVASIVVDQWDNVLYVDSAAISLGNYLYVNAAVKSSGIGSNTTLQVYLTDGTKSEVTLDSAYEWEAPAGKTDKEYVKVDKATLDKLPTTSTGNDANAAKALNGWYSYSVGSDGKYTIRKAKSQNEGNAFKEATTEIEGEKVTFVKGSTMVGNANTVLIVDDGDDVKVYTGVRNFPTIKVKSGSSATFDVYGFLEKDDVKKTYVAAAFVDASNADLTVEDGTQDNVLYILNQDSSYVDSAKNETVYVYNAILDGQETTIKAKDKMDEYTFSVRWSVDGDGFYKNNGTSNKTTYVGKDITGVIGVSGSSLKVNGLDSYIVTEDTDIVVVLVPNKDKSSADAVKNLKNDLMDNRAADYEVKTVNGKRLDSMLGDYDHVYGRVDMFVTESNGRVAETLYVTVYGVSNDA